MGLKVTNHGQERQKSIKVLPEGNMEDTEKIMEEKETEFLGLLEEMSKDLTDDDYKYMIEKFRGILRRPKWTKSGKYGG